MCGIYSHALCPLRIGHCERSGRHEGGKEEQLRLYIAANPPFVRKYEIMSNEQLASINEFISRTRDKMVVVLCSVTVFAVGADIGA